MADKDFDEIKILSKKIRRKILDLSHYAGASSSHFGGALSSVEIIATLFGKIMNLLQLKQIQKKILENLILVLEK